MFTAYKAEQIRLPKGWRNAPLSEVIASLDAGVSVNGEDRPLRSGEKGVLKVSAVSYGRLDPDAVKAVTDQTEIARLGESIELGRVIVSRCNSPDLVGASSRVDVSNDGLFLSDKLWQLKARNRQDDSWIGHVLQLGPVRSALSILATGTSDSMKNISQDDFLGLKIPTPPAAERIRIGSLLDEIAAVAYVSARRLKVARLRRRTLMQQLLTGKRRFPGFLKSWKISAMGAHFQMRREAVEWSDDDEYSLLSVRRRCGGTFLRGKIFGRDIGVKKTYRVTAGDILVSIKQVCHGAIAIVPPEFDGCHVSDSYVVLRPRKGGLIDHNFFSWLLKTPLVLHMAIKSSHGVHIEKMFFDPKFFLKQAISFPEDKNEQAAIAAALNASDREISLLERLLSAYQLQKRGLMQQLLTGKWRVKVAAVAEAP